MSNTTNNANAQAQNPMKVITGPETRWSYANIWEAKSINGGMPKFSVSLIIPKSGTRTIAKVKAAIEAAYREGEAKLKGNGKPRRHSPHSRPRSATATRNALTIRLAPTHTSSTPTARPRGVWWTPTATKS